MMMSLVVQAFRRCHPTGYGFSAGKQYVASIDQSTTSTKFSLFEANGVLVDQEIIKHKQHTPEPGWLEHNPSQIIENTYKAANIVAGRVETKGINIKNILGLGICNQRETVVCWDDKGEPLCNAIVWSDTRTRQICEQFQGKFGTFKEITGLPISSYFTVFKIIWILKNIPGIKQKLEEGNVRFGTIDSWLTYKLTGEYVTDASNASRTYLCKIEESQWHEKLLQIAGLKKQNLPRIVDSFGSLGKVKSGALQGVPVHCILGDQHSSFYAHELKQKQTKITFGTGCFLLTKQQDTKPRFSSQFVTTVLSRKNGVNSYGYEASVQCGGGTINWAHSIGLFEKYDELNDLPEEIPRGLFFFPSFGSVLSPFWKENMSGGFVGLNYHTTRQHLMKAILNSITFRVLDNVQRETFNGGSIIIADGGLCANKSFMQMQADALQKPIEVRKLDTCWGVAKGVLTAKGLQIEQNKFEATKYKPDEQKGKKFLWKYSDWKRIRQY